MSIDDDEDFFDASQHSPGDVSSPVAPLSVNFEDNAFDATDTVADHVDVPVDDSDSQSQITASQHSQDSQESQESQESSQETEPPTMQGKFKTKSVGEYACSFPPETLISMY